MPTFNNSVSKTNTNKIKGLHSYNHRHFHKYEKIKPTKLTIFVHPWQKLARHSRIIKASGAHQCLPTLPCTTTV